jgi:hypothetical protein
METRDRFIEKDIFKFQVHTQQHVLTLHMLFNCIATSRTRTEIKRRQVVSVLISLTCLNTVF